jgi:hypothetical protein
MYVDLSANGKFLSTGSRDGETLVHQIYDYDYCFHAFRGYSIMRNLKIVTPERVTGYPTSEPCGCPIRSSSFINRTETVTASVR